jgi:flagellar basal body P-ring protein FlgI
MFDAARPESQRIFALAGGRVELPDPNKPTRGVVRGGAVLEADFFYNFIEDGAVTLVINDNHAGWPMAHAIAQAINHELSRPATRGGGSDGRAVEAADVAEVLGPKNVRVFIPDYELESPSLFIKRVLEAEIFEPPKAVARVTINRIDHSVVLEGSPTVSPTTVFVAGLGSVTIGKPTGDAAVGKGTPGGGADATLRQTPRTPTSQPAGEGANGPARVVSLDDFLATLALASVPPAQVVRAIENLHRSGALRAQLVYRE